MIAPASERVAEAQQHFAPFDTAAKRYRAAYVYPNRWEGSGQPRVQFVREVARERREEKSATR